MDCLNRWQKIRRQSNYYAPAQGALSDDAV